MYCSPNVWAWSHADIVKYDNCVEMYNISKQWEWKKCTELRSDWPAATLNGAVKQGTIETETSCVSVKYVHPQKNNSNKMPYVLTFIRKKNVLTLNLKENLDRYRYNISFLYRDPSHSTYYIACIFAHCTFCEKEKKFHK